ncbi:MAG TPA: hypothetical protein VEI52_06970 [Terriglobales bacterium]|nr:hypothetical protein [Terriglobales bacterium]
MRSGNRKKVERFSTLSDALLGAVVSVMTFSVVSSVMMGGVVPMGGGVYTGPTEHQ